MTARKSPGGCDAGAKVESSQNQPLNTSKSQPPQARLGASRRLVDGRWVAASPSTTMMSAFVKAQQIADAKKSLPAKKPRQMFLSDFGVMPQIYLEKQVAKISACGRNPGRKN